MFPERSLGLHHFLLSQTVAPASVQLWLHWERSSFAADGTLKEKVAIAKNTVSYELIMVIMRRSEKEGNEEDLSSC